MCWHIPSLKTDILQWWWMPENACRVSVCIQRRQRRDNINNIAVYLSIMTMEGMDGLDNTFCRARDAKYLYRFVVHAHSRYLAL